MKNIEQLFTKKYSLQWRIIDIFFWLLCLSQALSAQNLFFQSYTTSNGLSQNSIYSIAQTKDGFMWFGTQDGINRFDGKSFVHLIPTISSDSPNIKVGKISKMITALLADKKDRLWLGTTSGLALYDRYVDRFLLPSGILPGFKVPEGVWVEQIQEDAQRRIWILTRKFGVYCYEPNGKKMLVFKWPNSVFPDVRSLSIDGSGQVWIATKNRIFLLSGSEFREEFNDNHFSSDIISIKRINGQLWVILDDARILLLESLKNHRDKIINFKDLFKGNIYLTDPKLLHQSDQNTVWIGSRSEGLLKIDLVSKTFKHISAISNQNALKSQFTLSFYTDEQHITWIGQSVGGVSKYDPEKVQFNLWRKEVPENKTLPDNSIFSIYSENDVEFYLGTLQGGLLYYNKSNGRSIYYNPLTNNNGKSGSNNIYNIIKGEGNLIWMASWGGLLSFDKMSKKFTLYNNPNDEQTGQLTSIWLLKNENKILVGGYNGGLRYFDLTTKKWQKCKDIDAVLDRAESNFRVRYMKEIGNGEILMCTESLNLIRYNYISGKFTFYPEFQKISGTSRHFCVAGKYIWIATDDGLIQAHLNSMQIKKVWLPSDGLPDNYIYAVASDRNDRIWMSTNRGLAMLDSEKRICKNYTEADGLQSMEFNTASCYVDPDQNIWFGGVNGINMITPGVFTGGNYSPSPFLTGINVMNSPLISDTSVTYLNHFTLPYYKNFISFEFQAPNHSQSENIIYKYKLTGVDTGWINNGTRNFVNYTQLKPGNYKFMVLAANANYVWSEHPCVISLTITPPWYQTWLFYISSFLLVGISSYYFVKQRISTIRYKIETKHKIIETEMAALKAQMNPHFMFNCINSIDAFIQSNDKYQASMYLSKFARLIRNVLDSSTENVILFAKDVDTLKLYIEMELLRNENKFKVDLEIDEGLMLNDYKVPPLILQPFVENSILHGLRNLEDKSGILKIMITSEANRIKYVIEDNGIGRAQSTIIKERQGFRINEKSYGMEMSLKRIKLFNEEDKASFQIEDMINGPNLRGTKIVFYLNKK